jgi:hypothetical protein
MRLQLMRYRALRSIEQQLRCDDALDTLFALFARLNRGEALPAHERLGGLKNLRRKGDGARHGRQASP